MKVYGVTSEGDLYHVTDRRELKYIRSKLRNYCDMQLAKDLNTETIYIEAETKKEALANLVVLAEGVAMYYAFNG